MSKLSIADLDLAGKRVFMRVDYNVPIEDGRITDDTRIKASLPSVRFVLEKGGPAPTEPPEPVKATAKA